MADDGGDLWSSLGYQAPSDAAQSASYSPDDLKALVSATAKKYGIPEDLADRWVQQESSYNPKNKSKKGALGLTQLMPDTATRLGVKDPLDPAQNVEGGAQELSRLHTKYGDWGKAFAAYNAGETAVDKAGGIPKIAETQNYVKTILGSGGDAGGASGAPGASGDLWSALGYKAPDVTDDGAPAEAESATGAQFMSYKDATPGQRAFFAKQDKSGLHDETAPVGDAVHPYFENADHPLKATPPGAYVVDKDGTLHKMPGGPQDSSFTAGAGQGLGDIAATISHLIPGTDDSTVKNALLASQDIYNAKYGGDLKSGAGRFTGQTFGSLPFLAGSEGLVAPLLSKLGPVGNFILGNAGKAGVNAAGEKVAANLLTRGGSIAASQLLPGAEAAALTSSANPEEGPLWKQALEGAGGAAVAGPILHGVGAGASKLGGAVREIVEPLLPGGPNRIANRIVGEFAHGPVGDVNTGEIVPGSTPTLAQAQADPGLAVLERTMRDNPTTAGAFSARDLENNAARGDVLSGLHGDEQTVADLVKARQDAMEAQRSTAFHGTSPAEPAPILQAIDDGLSSQDAHIPEVKKTLEDIRGLVETPPPPTSPEQLAEFNRKVSQSFGHDAPAQTQDVMDAAKSALGKKFEDIAANTQVPWDDKLRTSVGDIIHRTAQVVPESSLPPLFKQLDNIVSTANDGKTISGASYQALTARGSALSALQGSADPTIRQAANDIRNALDDALERSLAGHEPGTAPTEASAVALARATAITKAKSVLTEFGADPDSPKFKALFQGAERGAYDITTEGSDINVMPRHPADWKVTSRGQAYDPKYATEDENGRVSLKDPSAGQIPAEREPGYIYRGMSAEEYAQAKARGYFESTGQSNIGAAQDGLTYYSHSPKQAQSYAHGFAAWQTAGTPETPPVVVKIKAPDNAVHVPGTDPDEVGVKGRVPVGDVTEVYTGKAIAADPGRFTFNKDVAGGHNFSGSSAPQTSIVWEKGEPKVSSATPPALAGEGAAKPGSPLAELRDTRLKYKNLKTVEAALRSAGPDAQVTPKAVMAAVKSNFSNYAYKGGGPLGDAAEAALKEEAGRAPTVERNPAQLHGIRQRLDSAISKLSERAASGTDDAAATAQRRLEGVRDVIDKQIEAAAPGYGDMLKTSAAMKEPIEAEKYLQKLKLTDDASKKITLARVSRALDKIAADRARSPDNPANSISPETIKQLQALHDDLLRENNKLLAMPVGSPTGQRFSVGDRLQKLGVPGGLGLAIMGHPHMGLAMTLAKPIYAMREKQLMGAVANRLLDPNSINSGAILQKKPGLLKALGDAGKVMAPAATSMAMNRLLGQ